MGSQNWRSQNPAKNRVKPLHWRVQSLILRGPTFTIINHSCRYLNIPVPWILWKWNGSMGFALFRMNKTRFGISKFKNWNQNGWESSAYHLPVCGKFWEKIGNGTKIRTFWESSICINRLAIHFSDIYENLRKPKKKRLRLFALPWFGRWSKNEEKDGPKLEIQIRTRREKLSQTNHQTPLFLDCPLADSLGNNKNNNKKHVFLFANCSSCPQDAEEKMAAPIIMDWTKATVCR